MFLFGLFILFIGIIGLGVTLIFIIIALIRRKNRSNLKRAGISLSTTVILVLLLILLDEKVFYPPNPKSDQLVLTAYREAPIGGYWLGLYNDSTWELGNSSREIEISGKYRISGDTLSLKTFPETTFYNGDTNNSFIIHSDDLIEVKNTGIKGLTITMNKLSKNGL